MRSRKTKNMKKLFASLLAAFMFYTATGLACLAAAPVPVTTWDDAKTNLQGGNSVKLNNSITAPADGAGTITVGSGTVVIDGNNMTINGYKDAGGNKNTQVLINNSSNDGLTVQNATVNDGYATTGGAMRNTGVANLNNVNFTNNSAYKPNTGGTDKDGVGGAVSSTGTLNITNSTFTGNTAVNTGGAVHSQGETAVTHITDTKFTGNEAEVNGGAITNTNGSTMTITGHRVSDSVYTTEFKNNISGVSGGAITNLNVSDDRNTTTELTVNGVNFEGNNADTNGGAIYNTDVAIVQNSRFYKNTSGQGGAINNDGRATESAKNGNIIIENNYFEENLARAGNGGAINNSGDALIHGNTFYKNGYTTETGGSTNNGGAIYNAAPTGGGTGSMTVSQNNTFTENYANNGGAIYNAATTNADNTSSLNITNNTFTGNYAKNQGGAFYNGSASTATIENATFTNNGKYNGEASNTVQGGAIYNAGTVNIVDSNFSGNVADTGGAIYGANSSITNIKAEKANSIVGLYNPRPILDDASAADTIHLAAGTGAGTTDNAVLNLSAKGNNIVQINSQISGGTPATGAALANVNINADPAYTGKVQVNNYIKNSNITLNKGMLQFTNDQYLTASNTLNLNGQGEGTLNIMNGVVTGILANTVNVNSDTNMMVDVNLADKTMDGLFNDNINNVNVIGGSHINISGMTSITDTSADSTKILFSDIPNIIGNGTITSGVSVVDGPLYKYNVSQIFDDGTGPDGDRAGEYFMFTPVGNSDSVIVTPVAAQLGGFLLQDNIYRQAFANMDMVMLMTARQRQEWKARNKYTLSDADMKYLQQIYYVPALIPEDRDGWYMRPYSNFENVPLKNGPKVSNVTYGSLFGGESDIIDMGHGWDGMYSVYGAYNGSHQAFGGIGMYQNGGTLGFTGTAYKGNFYTGITANVGASAVEAHTKYGNEGFGMLMTGIAWKSGYNWELADAKFIIQPSYMMSYTWVGTEDYTNAAGLHITNDPLNAIEIIPGLKLIANTKNGWQPYLGMNMTWNIMDKTHFYANEVALSQLSVKPYFEYGLGIQKRVGNIFTGFGQFMIRNGGRNGIAFTFGGRWAIGEP